MESDLMNRPLTQEQDDFLRVLQDNLGLVTHALQKSGVKRPTYKLWLTASEEFRNRVDDIQEIQKDYVEGRLLEQIKAGDTTAIIFYCKSRMKDRGYTEKVLPPQKTTVSLTECVETDYSGPEYQKKLKSRRTKIVKMLKEQGKYSKEMTEQVTIAAQLLIKMDTLSKSSNSDKIFLDTADRAQRALKALGMNTDSKDMPGKETDQFSDFVRRMNEPREW